MSARHPTAEAAGPGWRRVTVSLGMWVFIASEAMFFGALFLAYLHTRLHDPGGFASASRLAHEWLGTINAAILITSSFTMALAVRSAALHRRKPLTRFLAATAFLGTAFLGVKATEYVLEWRDGLVPGLHFTYGGEDAAGVARFFYLYFAMTGVHAVHLAIGIAAVGWMAARASRSAINAGRRDAIEVLGLYWHFVDAVWIVLYPLFYLVALYR